MEKNPNWKKYAYTFLITAAIFITAIYLSNFFSQKKLNEIKNIESRIAVDILSSETQFSLLEEISCKDVESSFLSKEMNELGEKLAYTEENRGTNDEEVQNLKRYYSLLQIKDYLLTKKVSDKCKNINPLSIMYFYSNEGDCPDCNKEGFVLTRLRQEYPELRVYSFDYNLNLSAIKTLISINKIKNNPPAILIGEEIYYGFSSIDEIKEIIPELKEIDKQKEKEKELEKATSTEDIYE